LGSTLFGIVMTMGLHYYKGMVMGLAIQAVMAPFNLAENALVKAVFMGSGSILPESKIFDEKTAAELSPDDEVVDESGNPVVRSVTGGTTTAGGGTAGAITAAKDAVAAKNKQPRQLEDILLDTWDAGAKADLSELMGAMTKKNCNYQTKEDRWSALMVLAGIGAKGTASAIRQVQELGGNPAVVDKEGWNALHWAAFHGSVEAANELRKETKLLAVKDKEGQTPVDSARKEGNNEVADIFEKALGDTKKSK
jgi:ankyrin repeat protein